MNNRCAKRIGLVIGSVAVSLAALVVHAATGRSGSLTIDWYTIDGGGEMWSTGGDYRLGGTIGQPDANDLVMSGGTYTLTGGFWAVPAASVAVCTCGDIDGGGGLVDLNDFATFAICYGLSGTAPGCSQTAFDCSDLDASGNVDLNDFATLALWYGLSATQSPPDCGP